MAPCNLITENPSEKHIDPVKKIVGLEKNRWCYEMSGKKYLIILSHHSFEKFKPDGKWPSTTNASIKDEERLKEVFGKLDFTTITQRDFKHQQIIDYLAEFASSDHSETSCICVAILTHGTKGGMVCAADRMYPLSEAISIFDTKSLANKPKIFIIQACRGTKKDPGYHLDVNSHRTALHRLPDYLSKAGNYFCSLLKACGGTGMTSDGFRRNESDLVQHEFSHADTVVLYSSIEGYRSYRDSIKGSPMVQELCNAMDKYVEVMHFTEMVTVMQGLVAGYRKKQMPVVTNTATKFLKFRSCSSDHPHTKHSARQLSDGGSVGTTMVS